MFHPFLKRFYWFGMLLLRSLVYPINRLLHLKKPPPLPMIRNKLLLETASSLARMIRKRQVTSEEVVQAYISRIRDVNPLINAVVEDRFELAVQESRLTDTLIQSGAKSEKELEGSLPFLGVPLSVKESIAVKGLSHTAGEHRQKGYVAPEDAEVVRLMRAAGAIPLMVTNTPELCLNFETYNAVTGVTRNPYDTRRTPGGSSGGEAALLSSAGSVIGLGSDIAGSARLPAFFTGIFGHKPTPGVVSIDGHYPSATDKDFYRFLSLCPMSRYADDLLPMLRVLAQKNLSQLRLHKEVDIKKLKIYYMEDDAGSESSNRVNPEITGAMRSAVAYLEKKYEIKAKKVCFKNLKHGLAYGVSIIGSMKGVSNVFQKTRENPEDWNSVFIEFLKFFTCLSKHSYTSLNYGIIKKMSKMTSEGARKKLRDEATALRNEIKEVLGKDGVLLFPTFTDLAYYHYETYFRLLNVTYTLVWNVLELPVTQCPLGLGRNGLPVGVQLVGAPFNDRLTIALAKEFETAFGGWVPPPSGSDVVDVRPAPSTTLVSTHKIMVSPKTQVARHT